MNKEFLFDVAFSFAGEQRPHARSLYDKLTSKNLKVFYDEGQLANIWGKDLYQYLSDIYQNKARYSVIFLSQEYANKLWTKHELKALQARAFKESEEYILPIRFDDTELPGLLPTIAYINWTDYTVTEISDLIYKKINSQQPFVSSQYNVSNQLEISLSDAVIWADEYLKPQPLELSDKIAQSVRQSFKNLNIKPDSKLLTPYLLNDSASFRVVGYFAYQIKPFTDAKIGLNLLACLNKEKTHASIKKETRPLWQLLVCMHRLLTMSADRVNTDNRDVILYSLKEMLSFLESKDDIDRGGQCKQRIRDLLNHA
jgi:hypothetical protein